MLDKNDKRQKEDNYYKKWVFLVLGMACAFCIYLIYSNLYGSNLAYNKAISNTTNIVQTTSSTSTTDNDQITTPTAYLGIKISDITDELIENLDLKGKVGVFVENVIAACTEYLERQIANLQQTL